MKRYKLLKKILAYFDEDTTNVPSELYKKVFNKLYPPLSSPPSTAAEKSYIPKDFELKERKIDWDKILPPQSTTNEQPIERIEVGRIEKHDFNNMPYWYQIETNELIPEEKFPAITQAIEAILNNVEYHSIPGFMFSYNKGYTQQQMDEAIEKHERLAFNAAKCGITIKCSNPEKTRFVNDIDVVNTFDEYKNHPKYEKYISQSLSSAQQKEQGPVLFETKEMEEKDIVAPPQRLIINGIEHFAKTKQHSI